MRSLLFGTVLMSGLLVSACSTDPADPTRTAGTTHSGNATWHRVTLPDELTAVTLAGTDGSVLVGAYGPTRPHPHLLSRTDAGTWSEVPLTPRSPYAFEGRWLQIAVHDDRIDAVAGARGGAHGNYRWTTWSGTKAGVAEQEQPFGVFGSYGAGDLVGIAYAGVSPVVLGAWQSDRTGLDIATWARTGKRWARQQSTDTPLGSTPVELVSASAITPRGGGLLLSGSVTRLAPGSVQVDPAVWTSPDGDGPWTRVDLPHVEPAKGGGLTQAHAATCTPERCLVSGVTGTRFTLWEVRVDTTTTPPGIPEVEVTENASVLAPVTLDGKDVFVAPTDGGSTVLRRSGESWTVDAGPDGTPVSAVVHGDELWVVTTDAEGTGTVWRSRVR